ncbi:MAG: ribose-phosphate pyrophosphokinase-like domain-containing protein, partial [Nitrososphaera sp.]|nr:ribose-phosphate pyrophosphokinase-like domain-containing protein [Nitrososphaera sp.]
MHTINLDGRFKPFGEGHSSDRSTPFPSGAEVNFCLDAAELPKEVRITCRIRNSDDFLRLLMATDACRRLGAREIHVFIPCLPYARQDRVCNEGEAFSLKVIAEILNAQKYGSVTMFDVHSDVAAAVIDKAVIINNHGFVAKVLADKSGYIIVSP